MGQMGPTPWDPSGVPSPTHMHTRTQKTCHKMRLRLTVASLNVCLQLFSSEF